jgi:DNA adenine methylase
MEQDCGSVTPERGGRILTQTAPSSLEDQAGIPNTGQRKTATSPTLPGISVKRALPFLKWAGGKGQLLDQLSPHFPKAFNRYFEPFLGSASVYFFLRNNRPQFAATLIDANADLINCFEMVKEDLDGLLPLLRNYQRRHAENFYYKTREQKPASLGRLERAARFIYLNKTCYNGLYRVNKSGAFNVPIGSYPKPKIFDEDNLRAVSEALQGTTLLCAHFSKVLAYAHKGDLVYFDPPYFTETNGFTSYAVSASGRTDFTAGDHKMLERNVADLIERGCKVVVSNSDTQFIRRLYKQSKVHVVAARRYINCNGSGRGRVEELVITG